MKFEFAKFDRDTELGLQRSLFSECFPENTGQPPETEAFYRRKFTGYPATPPSYEYIARDDNGLAGYYAALPFTYRIGANTFRCGMVCDVMTAPRLRGKGVFTKLGAYSLAELERAGLDFVSGYPRRPEVIPGHLKVGWKIAFPLPLFLSPLRSNALLRARFPRFRFAAPLTNAALALVNGAGRALLPSTAGIETRLMPWRAFLDTFDVNAFSARWLGTVQNGLVKTCEFLRWRLSIQETDYWIVTAERGGELLGVSILRHCQPEGVPALALIDLMCLRDGSQLTTAMQPRWHELARQTGAEAVLTMMSDCRYKELGLWRCGFLKTPVKFSLILKALSDRAKAQLSYDTQHWNLMWIDSDDL